jgi:hypothetical protein
MSTTFDTLVKDQGPDLWRIGRGLRMRFHHQGRCNGTSWLIGGPGCTHECERWLEDALLEVARFRKVWDWQETPKSKATDKTTARKAKTKASKAKTKASKAKATARTAKATARTAKSRSSARAVQS